MCIVEAVLVETKEVFTPLFGVAAVLLVIVRVVVELTEAGIVLRVDTGRVGVMMEVNVVVVTGALLGRVVALGTALDMEPCSEAEDTQAELLVPDK